MGITQYVIGSWKLGEDPHKREEEIKAIRYALDEGCQWIDTAEMYGEGQSESLIGEAIAPYKRDTVKLISKVYPWHANREHMRRSLMGSLERLNTDYLDVYLLHWLDESVDLKEVVELFEVFKEEGLIKDWGVSNFDVQRMEELIALPKGSHVWGNQVLYNLGSRGIEYDLIPWMKDHKTQLMAYSVLGHSFEYRERMLNSTALHAVARRHDKTPYQILLAFVMHVSDILVIAKAGTLRNMILNLEALEITLTVEDIHQLNVDFPGPTHKVELEEI